MSNWPINNTNLSHSPEELLEEFNLHLNNSLRPVLEKNSSWKGICLYHKNKNFWDNTENKISLEELPVLSKFISHFFEFKRIRQINIYNLEPDSFLHPHRDMEGNLIAGMIRVHYCLKTNPSSFLTVGGYKQHIPEGRFASFSTSELHTAENTGSSERYHIVFDIQYCLKHSKFFPNINFKILLNLVKSTLSILLLLCRDILFNPSSVVSRLASLFKK